MGTNIQITDSMFSMLWRLHVANRKVASSVHSFVCNRLPDAFIFFCHFFPARPSSAWLMGVVSDCCVVDGPRSLALARETTQPLRNNMSLSCKREEGCYFTTNEADAKTRSSCLARRPCLPASTDKALFHSPSPPLTFCTTPPPEPGFPFCFSSGMRTYFP